MPKDLALHQCLPDDGFQLPPPPNFESLPMVLGASFSIYNKTVGKEEKTTTKNSHDSITFCFSSKFLLIV